MVHYLPLESYTQLYHPNHLPLNPSIQPHSASSLASLTSYTNQLFKSAQEHEDQLAALYEKISEKNDKEAFEKMDDEENEKDTAYLIEKTDQQTFVSFVVGVVLTGLLYTGLLIFKPPNECNKKEKDDERMTVVENAMENFIAKHFFHEETNYFEGRTSGVTGSSLTCTLLSSPFLTSVMIVWVPILIYTILTGFMVREVELLGRNDDTDDEDAVDVGNIAQSDNAQFVTSEKLKTPVLSRYDLYNSQQFHNIGF